MTVKMEEIALGLECFGAVPLMSGQAPDTISSVRFATDDLHIRDDVLLLVESSRLNPDSPLPACNMIILGGEEPADPAWIEAANIIWINGGWSLPQISNAVQDLLASRAEAGSHAPGLLDTIIQGRGFQQLVEMGSRIFERPIVLVDSGFKILGHSSGYVLDEPGWQELIHLGYLPWEFINALKNRDIINKVARSPRPIIITSWMNEGMERILGKIEADGHILGYLVVMASGRFFSEADIDLAALLCQIMAADMRRGSGRGDPRNLVHDNLLLDLLGDNIAREEVALERARIVGFPAPRNMCAACIDVHRHQDNPYMIDYLKDILGQRFTGARTLYFRQYLLLLLDLKESLNVDEAMEDRLRDFMEKNSLTAGISRPFNRLVDLRQHFEQAVKALELAGIIDGTGLLFHYEDYKVYYLLQIASEREKLRSFCHPAVLALAEIDRQHNSRYLESLWAYLDCQQNLLAAASKLEIHRNTMGYRMGRISDLTGLELDRSEVLFQLQLSQRIIRYMEQLGGSI